MSAFLITANGPDRTGIVAAVTAVLEREGCNLEDTSMTHLGGRFVMLLAVRGAEGLTAVELRESLINHTQSLGLHVDVETIEPNEPQQVDGRAWAVTVYGADRPGIVAAVTGVLAEVGANVTDLATRVSGTGENTLYSMLIDVTIPAGSDSQLLEQRLDALGRDLGITCHARAVDVDTF